MNKKERKILITAAILFLFEILVLWFSSTCPEFAEWYTEHIYRVLTETVGRITGILPFSAAEAGLYILILVLLVTFVGSVVRKEKVKWLCHVILMMTFLFLSFVMGCGINYHHVSFSEHSGVTAEGYSEQELAEVCRWLTEKVNETNDAVERDADGLLRLTCDERDAAVEAMQHLGETYSVLEGYYPRAKKVLLSEVLSWQGITGIYSPFTIEANYNRDIAKYNLPFTVCHELSHLRGFMEEQEANFIAFLACTESENREFQYSGYLLGWIYGMNELKILDEEQWREIRGSLEREIERDLQANSEFWKQYEGKIEEISNRINDTYLKANGQEQGVESYNRMVDYIISYYRLQIKNAG